MLWSLTRIGVLGTLVGGTTLALVGADRMKLYYETGKEAIVSAIDEAQGMDAKLRLIRTQIHSLDDEERRLKRDAVQTGVELESLRRDIADRESSLERQGTLLDKVAKLLADGSVQYAIGGRTYERSAVERDAAEKLAVYDVQKETLASLKETLATKEKANQIAAENVSRAAALRADLRAQVTLLEAKLEKFRAKQNFAATVEDVIDSDELDSALARAKEMMRDFAKQLEVKDRMLDEQLKSASSQLSTGIDYEREDAGTADLSARIRASLAGSPSNGVAADRSPRIDVTVH